MTFVVINSMYSFWWDVSVDWNLVNVTNSPTSHSASSTTVVRFRKHHHFSDTSIYYVAMAIDFLLRTTWSLKLSSHLYIQRLQGSIFMMELLEVIRRWVWVIFRMENEWMKRTHGTLPTQSTETYSLEQLQNSGTSKLLPIREENEDGGSS